MPEYLSYRLVASGEIPSFGDDSELDTLLETRVRKAPRYAVIMLNDDKTPMAFVVGILMLLFEMNQDEATAVMWQIHTEGSAVCGVYSLQVAETKVAEVFELAEANDFPLQCALEREFDDDPDE